MIKLRAHVTTKIKFRQNYTMVHIIKKHKPRILGKKNNATIPGKTKTLRNKIENGRNPKEESDRRVMQNADLSWIQIV